MGTNVVYDCVDRLPIISVNEADLPGAFTDHAQSIGNIHWKAKGSSLAEGILNFDMKSDKDMVA